ncbi:hypothetical protein TNIN_58741 [Trichonephila inaurata madagascariensis]|uniref:Uncharacterized protein n=1 Tax=Trichonephila inaurata madagascariensis TaxID=2747483 RepID=A0A8X6XIX2_9ARAC|nr:hypothetical protein TNIN_437821 [Trichonephila inaurata madagascariensis]GFY52541.1 hypothetical protein TNIN_58741 [Trichonephila inaurata madagascariensis]
MLVTEQAIAFASHKQSAEDRGEGILPDVLPQSCQLLNVPRCTQDSPHDGERLNFTLFSQPVSSIFLSDLDDVVFYQIDILDDF